MRRADGNTIRSNDPMYQVVPFVMSKRYDATNEIDVDIDLEPIQEYIKECRVKGTPVSHLSLIVSSYLRMASQNPFVNRFCMNKKIFARNHFCVSMVTLTPSKAGNTVNKVYLNLDDDIFTVNRKINEAIDNVRYQNSNNSMDKLANKLTSIPLLLRIGTVCLKALDKLLTMPFWAIDASPFHTSLFITNLASIRSNAVYHHLYEFGTTGVFISMGQPEKKTYINDEGDADELKVMNLKITTDERIADGHYYVKCFKDMSKYLKNPKALEEKPESVIYDPDVKRKKWKWITKENGQFIKKILEK